MFQPGQAMTVDHAQDALEDGLRAIAAGQTQFDLSNVKVVDSSAVAVLLSWQRAAAVTSNQILFSSVPATLMSLIAVYGVAGLLKVDVVATTPARELHPH